ncbi:MAG: NAD(P)H-binding protein, partial [Anaerolineales bacterium]|nr:NAD(P)H-binding protein [Anaerolineales bacterium]
MPSPLILVTGAAGYIASLLIPQLLARGYRVRALARQPERLKSRTWYPQVEMARGDVMQPETLITALDGVQTVYYLIHNMSFGRGYMSIEIAGARNFAEAAEKTGVEHII